MSTSNSFYYKSNIVTSGSSLLFDAGNLLSYPNSGSTITNLSTVSSSVYGILSGSVYTTSGGGAFACSDTVNHISIGNNFDFWSSSFTVSAWVYPTGSGNVNSAIFSTGKDGGEWQWYYWYSNERKFGFQIYDGTLIDNVLPTTVYQTSSWYYVTARYNTANKVMDLFIGSSSIGAATSSKGCKSKVAGYQQRFGGFLNVDWGFPGYMATCQVYQRALTNTEISQNYDEFKLRYGQ